MARLLRTSLWIGVLGLVAITAVSHLGRLHWGAELLSHFRAQWAAAAGILLVPCALWRLRAPSLLTAAALLAHAAPLGAYLLPRPPLPQQDAVLRLALANVHTANLQHAPLREWILRTRPDVLGLLEVNERWLEALRPLRPRYPHRLERPQQDNFGIALWSRVPLQEARFETLGHERVAIARAQLQLGSRRSALVLAHPVPPAGGALAALRDRQLSALASLRDAMPGRELILLGDLNTSPWSPRYRALEREAGLHNAALGHGYQPTWPTWLRAAGIPIDHVLLSSGLRATRFERGPPIGSDHRPLLVEVRPLP